MRPPARALLAALLSLGVAAVAVPSASAAPHSSPKLPHGLGAIPSSAQVPASAFLASHARATQALPVSVDLSANAPAIGDQGQVGSCTTWAIGYGILGYYAKTQPHAGAPFAPLSLYNLVNGGGDNGSSSYSVYQVLQNKGVVEQAVWTHGPADYRSQPNATEAANALKHRTTGGVALFSGQNQGPNATTAIETALAAGKPVAIAIPVYMPFEYLNATDSTMTTAKVSGQLLGGHMLAAYGYDQTGLKIANSWGTYWGKSGWGTLSWDFVNKYAYEATTPSSFVSADPKPNPTPTPTPTPAPAPTVTGVDPRTALTTGGTVATVKGTNFATSTTKAVKDAALQVAVVSAADATKRYPATVTTATATQLTVTLPAVPSDGAYRLVVTTAGGASADTPADDVTYVKPLAISVAPGTKVLAATGGTVKVLGSGFGSTNANVANGTLTASVNGARVAATWISDGVLGVQVPAGTPGLSAAIVVTRQGVASAPVAVPYVGSVGALSPASGPAAGGTLVTVTGRGFSGNSTWALTRPDGSVVAQLPVVTSLDKVTAGVLLQGDTKAVIKMPAVTVPFLPVVVSFTPDQKAYPGAASAPTAGAVFTYSDLG